jgi:hypothetical protein
MWAYWNLAEFKIAMPFCASIAPELLAWTEDAPASQASNSAIHPNENTIAVVPRVLQRRIGIVASDAFQ